MSGHRDQVAPLPFRRRFARCRSQGGLHGVGPLGGFFGLYAVAVELPFSTAIMLRSVAEIARSEGEDLDDIEARLSCVGVVALAAKTKEDNDAELGYLGCSGNTRAGTADPR